MRWPSARLNDLIEIADTGVWGVPSTADRGVPVLRSTNIQDGRLHLDEVAHIDLDRDELGSKTLQGGDILVTMSSGSPSHLGKCCLVDGLPRETMFSFSNFMLRLRPRNDLVTSHWLWAWLSSDVGRRLLLGVSGTTTGLRNIQKGRYLAQLVPVPPLASQRAATKLLDRSDDLLRKRREAQRLTDAFLRSAFLDMFGDPVANPRSWPQRPLADSIADVEAGWSAKALDRPAAPGEWGVLKISAVTSGAYRPRENKAVELNGIPRHLVVPRKGDLLFSRANTRELVGATCLVDREEPNLFLPDKLWRLTPTHGATREWLRFLLAHPRFRSRMARRATGTSGSMLNLSQAIVLGTMAPTPPSNLQERFSRVVWSVLALRATQETGTALGANLAHGIAAQVFEGPAPGGANF